MSFLQVPANQKKKKSQSQKGFLNWTVFKQNLLDALSILQASYWEKPQIMSLEDSIDFLVGFYGTEKLLPVGASSNSTVSPTIYGDLLRAQAKWFKEIMRDAVPSIREAVEKRRRQEKAREERARGAEQPEPVDEGAERREVKSLTQYVWAYLFKAGERHDISEFVKLALIMYIIPVSSVLAER